MADKIEKGADESTNTADNGKGAADPDKERAGLLAALEAERKSRQKLETKLAQVEGKVEGLKAGQSPATAPTEKVYTRAELRTAVTAGQITDEQMEALWEKQIEAKFDKKLSAKTDQAAASTRATAFVEAELAKYTEAFPDLLDADSDMRTKVQTEFDYLTRLGDPQTIATELKAVRAAIGPIAPKGRKKDPETHEETGGSADTSTKSGDDGLFKGVPTKLKTYYEGRIAKGIYKGTAGARALKAELDIARARA